MATTMTSTESRNMELMQTLDDAWNAQDMEIFKQRHRKEVVVRWPGKKPTHGIEDHVQESLDLFRAFPDQKLDNRPYRVFFASGDWTCSIARFRGTMTGPMREPDGEDIPPTRIIGMAKDIPPTGIRYRVLHRRAVGGRPDRRGEPDVRSGDVHEADRAR